MDDLFTRFFDDWGMALRNSEAGLSPAINVEESDNEIIVTADIPGIDPKDLDISLDHNVLTIKGERKEEKEDKKKNYHRMERVYGAVQRSLLLPSAVDSSKISAKNKNGVVTITLPKTADSKRKKIEVKQE